MKVTIIGQGYVGLTISVFASQFFEVIGFDSNEGVVDRLNRGTSHIEGVESDLLKKRLKAGMYRATTRGKDVSESDIVVIAVPTPLTKDRQPDLSFIDSAC